MKKYSLCSILFLVHTIAIADHHNVDKAETNITTTPEEKRAHLSEEDKIKLDLQFFEAAVKGVIADIEEALDMGADIHTTDEEGNTALHMTAKKNFSKTSKFLVDHGADASRMRHDCKSPLDLAIKSSKVTQELLKSPSITPNAVKNALKQPKLHEKVEKLLLDKLHSFTTMDKIKGAFKTMRMRARKRFVKIGHYLKELPYRLQEKYQNWKNKKQPTTNDQQ